jgi:5-methylcytosine-specific restriction endonuclease McrA
MSLGNQKKRRRLRQRLIAKYGPHCMRCDPGKATPLRGMHHPPGANHAEPLLTIDHVIPEHSGGRATFDNLQLLCRPCHVMVDQPRKGGILPVKYDYRTHPPRRVAMREETP